MWLQTYTYKHICVHTQTYIHIYTHEYPHINNNNNNNNNSKERNGSSQIPRLNGLPTSHGGALNLAAPYGPSENNLNSLNLPHLRPQLYKGAHGFFQGSLPTTGGSVPLGQTSPYASLPAEPEQDEALSLVVTPKKKRHKVTDSRLTPRTVGRLLEDLPRYPHIPQLGGGGGGGGSVSPRGSPPPHGLIHPQAPPRPSFPQPPPPLLPVSLPTSVEIPYPASGGKPPHFFLLHFGLFLTFLVLCTPSIPDLSRGWGPSFFSHLSKLQPSPGLK